MKKKKKKQATDNLTADRQILKNKKIETSNENGIDNK